MARRCCCYTVDCSDPIVLSAALDWDIEPGGSIDSSGDRLVMDGPVNPGTYMVKQAYQVEFKLHSGSFAFNVGADTITVDHSAKTVSDGTTTVEYGRVGYDHHAFPETTVYLRVTPTHILAYIYNAYGNYGDPNVTNQPQFAHGAVVIERDGSDPPTAFTFDWTNAEIGDVTIRDSEVKYNQTTQALEKDCWVLQGDVCPYFAIKQLSKNHKYAGDSRFNYSDIAMWDAEVTGYEPVLSGITRLTPRKPMWAIPPHLSYDPLSANLAIDGMTAADTQEDWAQATPIGCGYFDKYRAYYEIDSGYFESGSIIVRTNPSDFYGRALLLLSLWFQYGDSPLSKNHTFTEPYPVPKYRASVGVSYSYSGYCGPQNSGLFYSPPDFYVRSDASVFLDVPINDLQNGFTLTAAGVMFFQGIDANGVYDLHEITPEFEALDPCDSPYREPDCCTLDYVGDGVINDLIRVPQPIDATWTL